MANLELSIKKATFEFLEAVKLSRSENTFRSYSNAMNFYFTVLADIGIDPQVDQVSKLTEDDISMVLKALKSYRASTEQLYLTAITKFYRYLSAEKLADINLTRIRLLIELRARTPQQRLPQFPKEAIDTILNYASELHCIETESEKETLRNYRDAAFIITLADTGLRVHEACKIRRGDIDWNEGKALVIGKGDRQDVVRFSTRALSAIKSYLSLRGKADGTTGKPLSSLPLFAAHHKGAGKAIKGITTRTGQNIIAQRATEALGDETANSITPHSFRHYFVTTVLLASQGNLKLAQELARHKNIAVTQRYAHLSNDELDRNYHEIFED